MNGLAPSKCRMFPCRRDHRNVWVVYVASCSAFFQQFDQLKSWTFPCIVHVFLVGEADDQDPRAISPLRLRASSSLPTRDTTYRGIFVLISPASSMNRVESSYSLAFQVK